jgi:hypothetical protein
MRLKVEEGERDSQEEEWPLFLSGDPAKVNYCDYA